MATRPPAAWDNSAHLRRIFNLLVVFRWLSLAPALISLVAGPTARGGVAAMTLAAAIGANLVITLVPAQLNRLIHRWPPLLGADLLFCAALLSLSGGSDSPYYLYSLSPLLAAAFFFHVPGALAAASAASVLFAGALVIAGASPEWNTVVAQVVSFFLIGGVFGYQPTLLARLAVARDSLERAHRDLEVIHDLTVSLQSAVDAREVEERVLDAVTGDLGFPAALVALVDPNESALTAWLGRRRDGQPFFSTAASHPARLPVSPESGPLAQALFDGQPRLFARDLSAPDEAINARLRDRPHHLFPMLLREHPVGVLLADASGEDDPACLCSLQSVAGQAAVAVGTTLLCIDRAQRLAVQEERIRIARDIHDTVTQSLFGMVYSLDACIKLLPAQPDRVRAELTGLLRLAEDVRAEVRQSILDMWPSQLTAERFVADLRRYVGEICRAGQLDLSVRVHGDFMAVPSRGRRSLYRIAQEALTNAVRHAGAARAWVCLDVQDGRAAMSVRDDGCGFDPARAMTREFSREHFGLMGIRDRAASLGGEAEIVSCPGAGTLVLVYLPAGEVSSQSPVASRQIGDSQMSEPSNWRLSTDD